MNEEQLRTALYEKMSAEQKIYKDWLLFQPPEEILNHTYEYTARQDIITALSEVKLTDEQAAALLDSPDSLSDILNDFMKIETDHMNTILNSIEYCSEELLQQNKPICNTPLYLNPPDYAREQEEFETYIASHKANIQCRKSIENAINSGYQNNSLKNSGADAVVKHYGLERTEYVLAATVLRKDWDERFSYNNRERAKNFPLTQNIQNINKSIISDFVVDKAHPGLVNIFIDHVRKIEKERNAQKTLRPSVLDKLKAAKSKDSNILKFPSKEQER